MGSLTSKNKITNLILESLKNDINYDNPISKMEPRLPLEFNEINENQIEISIDNENEIHNENENDDLKSLMDSNNNEIKINKNNYLQNCFGQIIFFKNDIENKITGSIIGENIILTLASLIYDFETKKFVSNISFKNINNKIFKNPEIRIYKNYIDSNEKKK